MSSIAIRQMIAADAMAIERQPAQRVQLGLEARMDAETAADLVDGGEAWTATRDGQVIACFGLRETFPPVQGVAWAILSPAIGAAHHAITRFAQGRIANSPLVRIEAVVSLARPADVKWALLCGLQVRCPLPKFGALSEDHLLMDRVR